MIPDEMLKKAAERSNEIYTAALEVSAPETEHTFSPEFEKKLRKLRRRVDHRILYRTLRWAACILLAVLLAGGALFVGDEGARASFVSWFKAIQSEYLHYSFRSDPSPADESVVYRPTWIPEGYELYYVRDDGSAGTVIYVNEQGWFLRLMYSRTRKTAHWFVQRQGLEESKPAEVNGNPAELLGSDDPGVAGGILWEGETGTMFFLSAFLDDEDLIRAAESVQEKK